MICVSHHVDRCASMIYVTVDVIQDRVWWNTTGLKITLFFIQFQRFSSVGNKEGREWGDDIKIPCSTSTVILSLLSTLTTHRTFSTQDIIILIVNNSREVSHISINLSITFLNVFILSCMYSVHGEKRFPMSRYFERHALEKGLSKLILSFFIFVKIFIGFVITYKVITVIIIIIFNSNVPSTISEKIAHNLFSM